MNHLDDQYKRLLSYVLERGYEKTDRTGTEVTFKPDSSIFVETIYHYDILAARLRELSFLNKGIHLSITDLRRKNDDGSHVCENFFSEVGLQEFVTFLDSTRESILEGVIYFDGEKEYYM